MAECAAEDPDYDIERELELLQKRHGFELLSDENEELFWFAHDVFLMGYELASMCHPEFSIHASKSYSVTIRLRKITSYLNELKYGIGPKH